MTTHRHVLTYGMIIAPIQDNLIVVPDGRETHTDGGLVIPGTAQQIILTGVVLAVGPGRARKEGGPVLPIAARPGDRVFYERHMGTEIKSDGRKVLLLREVHVVAVIGPDTTIEFPPPPPPPQQGLDMGSAIDV